jgi:general stress protein 26
MTIPIRQLRSSVLLAVLAGLIATGHVPAQPAPARPPSRQALIDAARRVMEAARYCAVITVGDEGRPQARAIDAFPPDADMAVWFATNPKSRKVAQIERDPRVTLYYFDSREPDRGYVTLFGRARLVNDKAEKAKRWKPGWEVFWPDRDAGYLLVEVSPERIEVSSPSQGIGSDPVTWAPATVEFPRRPEPKR